MIKATRIKYATALLSILMMLVSISGYSLGEKETTDRGTRTVLIEHCTATTCYYCHFVDDAFPYVTGDYERVSLGHTTYSVGTGYNSDINARIQELGEWAFPMCYFDGNYMNILGGWEGMETTMQNYLDICAERDVADVDCDLTVVWVGDAELQIDVRVDNNEASSYDGHVKVYILEIESRWGAYGGGQMVNGLLGFSIEDDISISASGVWTDQHTWDGDDYGYGDITSDNIRVLAVAFDQSTMYADDIIGVYPDTNFAPTAGFTYDPALPNTDDVIQFTDASNDVDGTIVSRDWDFDDGNFSTATNPTHNYSESGIYTVSLTVEDDGGSIDTYDVDIVVAPSGLVADVVQPLFDRGFRVMPGWDGAQEFVPSFGVLSCVDLYMSEWGTPWGPIVVQICEDSPDGAVVFSDTISPSVVPSFPTFDWVTVDVGISVDIGEKYVVVLRDGDDGDSHNTLMWGWCDSYGGLGPYPDGEFLFRKLDYPTWFPIHDWDFSMLTYSIDS